ncbi:hypothetical protein [Umezawaea sp. Da 62-37]|uniref:hypothetical protein n=1 Tax=Umezawaea sp. Da 62-37 TaxID=3075927 RepID=UPI0028F6FD47|nr:hypothetical protein [Umezawaea sp. Da 62-37]WNV88228.1 hypothetical protein RM788_08010 [Umezawaea sp. Da 62-37]
MTNGDWLIIGTAQVVTGAAVVAVPDRDAHQALRTRPRPPGSRHRIAEFNCGAPRGSLR